jgi:hypothetical protein
MSPINSLAVRVGPSSTVTEFVSCVLKENYNNFNFYLGRE